jgi:hypothetical protein
VKKHQTVKILRHSIRKRLLQWFDWENCGMPQSSQLMWRMTRSEGEDEESFGGAQLHFSF